MVNTSELSEQPIKELAFSPEELQELERARNMPITFDGTCPETTPEKAIRFKRVHPPRKTDQAPA